ncbi:MAG: tRNA (adenosine(37)-N6)-threonylcarbamoyltransferase complex ATPase subunit type 1 TsaE [Deltaproteobacteria bacterium]|nr:tRNA (adenosine(37)-N6)-threonylcarbamoyltransferase complex ATPase subunit type 1 TsaE [Deltaproteobacteria bacterium]
MSSIIKVPVKLCLSNGFSEDEFMTETLTLISNSPLRTREIANSILDSLHGGMSLALEGGLGAGKTEFVRGLAAALGLESEVSSPSFVLENIYSLTNQSNVDKSIKTLFHWDFYRLNNSSEPEELADNFQDTQALTIVEWPERVIWSHGFPFDLLVQIKFCKSNSGQFLDEQRELIIRGAPELITNISAKI